MFYKEKDFSDKPEKKFLSWLEKSKKRKLG